MATGDLTTFAFVFDMNRVFEGFLVNFIRRHRKEILPPDLWAMRAAAAERERATLLAAPYRKASQSSGSSRTSPSERQTFPLLIDAKYKRLPSDASGVDVGQDVISTKCSPMPTATTVPAFVMLYPQTADMPNAVCCDFALESANGELVTERDGRHSGGSGTVGRTRATHRSTEGTLPGQGDTVVSNNVDWKGKLGEWLGSNPKTMPDDRRKLLEEFVQRFPKEKLGEMTLEQYAGSATRTRKAASATGWSSARRISAGLGAGLQESTGCGGARSKTAGDATRRLGAIAQRTHWPTSRE